MIKQFSLPIIAVIALLFRFIISTSIYSGDVNNHTEWARSILADGSRGAYERKYVGVMPPTYPPLALYSFVISYLTYDIVYDAARSLNDSIPAFPSKIIWFLEDQDTLPAFHKITSIFADIGIGLLIYALARTVFKSTQKNALIASSLYLFNPAVFYNSALWGQLESIPLFWLLLAIWLLLKSKPVWSHLAFCSALLFKQSSLIFAPAFFLFSLKTSGWKKTLQGSLAQVALFWLSYWPFSPSGSLLWPFQIYYARLQTGSGSDYVTDHAFNLWVFFTNLQKISDPIEVIPGFSASFIGQIVFIVIFASLFWVFMKKLTARNLIHLLGLTGFAAFMVLTRMHERYLAPALPFMAIAASRRSQLWPLYLLISLGHLVNMYHNWWFPELPALVPLASHWYTISGIVVVFSVSWLSWMAVYRRES